MCGITGFVGRGDMADLRAMTAALSHRGPDGDGAFHDPEAAVFLGHRRLAIIDIEGGAQPMWDAEQTIGVTYNGEIYNHAELRQELEAKGHVFRTSHSDTEVLVQGYKEWGKDLPERLNGMFAFAIFDRPRQSVFLARDRFGEKPLYYAQQNGTFAFASELSALHHHRNLVLQVDRRSVQKYFAHGFFPAPNTLFTECRKLPGGSRLILDLRSGDLSVDRYWRFSLQPDAGQLERPEEELAEELSGLISKAVERRLVSDVPLGVFLSGGVDSSAVLGSAVAHRPPESMKSFTVGFTDPTFDESKWAAMVAGAMGTDHQARTLDLTTAQGLIPKILSKMDEPLGDPSLLPTHLLSRFTREQVTVALSGDGGDELFAGYDPFRALRPAGIYDALVPGALHKGLKALAGLLPISDANMSFDYKLRSALKGLAYGPPYWNPVWLSPVDPEDLNDLFEDPLPMEDIYAEVLEQWERGGSLDDVDKTLEFYTNFYLQDGILTKADRATMMVSLESRAVFLDNDLVDFCTRLPNRLKLRGGTTKYLLKKALRRLVPEAVLKRPKKGFGIPLSKWLRDLPLPDSKPGEGGVQADWIESCRAAHRSGRRDHRLLLWAHMGLQQCLAARSAMP